VNFFVLNPTCRRKKVFAPLLFNVYERTLPRTKAQMLKPAEQQVVGFRVHQNA
jgi:hypothetical protein